MTRNHPKPRREPGVPHATTVIMADLLPGTRAYTDLYREAPPILVVDTGPTEVQLAVPADRVSVEDLAIVDALLEAAAAYRTALLAHLD
jgi:hypothetical protein